MKELRLSLLNSKKDDEVAVPVCVHRNMNVIIPPHPTPPPPPPPTKPEMAGSQHQCARMTALCARMTRFLCARMTRLQCAQMTRFQCAQMTR